MALYLLRRASAQRRQEAFQTRSAAWCGGSLYEGALWMAPPQCTKLHMDHVAALALLGQVCGTSAPGTSAPGVAGAMCSILQVAQLVGPHCTTDTARQLLTVVHLVWGNRLDTLGYSILEHDRDEISGTYWPVGGDWHKGGQFWPSQEPSSEAEWRIFGRIRAEFPGERCYVCCLKT